MSSCYMPGEVVDRDSPRIDGAGRASHIVGFDDDGYMVCTCDRHSNQADLPCKHMCEYVEQEMDSHDKIHFGGPNPALPFLQGQLTFQIPVFRDLFMPTAKLNPVGDGRLLAVSFFAQSTAVNGDISVYASKPWDVIDPFLDTRLTVRQILIDTCKAAAYWPPEMTDCQRRGTGPNDCSAWQDPDRRVRIMDRFYRIVTRSCWAHEKRNRESIPDPSSQIPF